jgi:hypothetical protein
LVATARPQPLSDSQGLLCAVRPALGGIPSRRSSGAAERLCPKAKGVSVANTSHSQSLALGIAGAALIITLILFVKTIQMVTALAFPGAPGMPD